MMLRIKQLLMNSVAPLWAPEGVGGGGDGGGDKPEPDASATLFPNENDDADKGDKGDVKPEGEKEGDTPPPEGDAEAKAKADAEAEKPAWKDYVPDAAKSEAENAAAKLEHDKTKPVEPDTTVPEKYEIKLPDGMQLDEALLGAVSPVFKDLFLTNDQAQALVSAFVEHRTKEAGEQGTKWAETVTGWGETAKADPDIGGVKWDATVAASTRAINRLGTPALKEYLEASGGGNHPELIRVFAKVGAMIKEDAPPDGGAEGAGQPADPAHLLFPSDAPKG
jgi:hypothetical protein